MENVIIEIYKKLKHMYGNQAHWWPGKTPFHIALGAILTQNTSWHQAYKALINLINHKLDTPEAIERTDMETLKYLIRPAGFMNQKALYIKEFSHYLCNHLACEMQNLLKLEDPRKTLLKIKGIGKETADSILLYGLNQPYFVIDAYTKRIFSRLGLISINTNYDEVALLFTRNIPPDPNLYKEYHALIVEHAKQRCKKKNPICGNCKLRDLCSLQKKVNRQTQGT